MQSTNISEETAVLHIQWGQIVHLHNGSSTVI